MRTQRLPRSPPSGLSVTLPSDQQASMSHPPHHHNESPPSNLRPFDFCGGSNFSAATSRNSILVISGVWGAFHLVRHSRLRHWSRTNVIQIASNLGWFPFPKNIHIHVMRPIEGNESKSCESSQLKKHRTDQATELSSCHQIISDTCLPSSPKTSAGNPPPTEKSLFESICGLR
jgi:hypothetical protein